SKLFVSHSAKNPQLGRMGDENLRLNSKRRSDFSGKRGQIIEDVHVGLRVVASFAPVRDSAPIRAVASFPCDSVFVPAPGALCDSATVHEHLAFPFAPYSHSCSRFHNRTASRSDC